MEDCTVTLNQTAANQDHCVVVTVQIAQKIISLEVYHAIFRYTCLVVYPIIAFIGLVGNIFGGLILIKSGLDKASNVLLLGLSVSDFFAILTFLNIPYLLSNFSPHPALWVAADYNTLVVYYNLSITIAFLGSIALGMTTTLTVLITLERIVAVFLPLHFHRLITPFRAMLSIIASFLMQLPLAAVTLNQHELFALELNPNFWVGAPSIKRSYLSSSLNIYREIIKFYVMPIVPHMLVVVGCVLIAFKVRTVMHRRKKIAATVRNKSSSARTRTLFMVCLLFSVTRFSNLFTFLPQLRVIDLNHPWVYVSLTYGLFTGLLSLINSSCNFFIYVFSNPQFRKLFVHMLTNLRPTIGNISHNKCLHLVQLPIKTFVDS